MKHIIFGGFDYAVYFEMDADAILRGVDYFVDNDPKLIGTTYLGKPIKHPDALLEEDKNQMIILIGSIVFRTEIAFQLMDMGFEEGKHFVWGIEWRGDKRCSRLWRHFEWSNKSNEGIRIVEEAEIHYARIKVMARFIDSSIINTVVDWGSANERLSSQLPSNISYVPVDYIRYTQNTIVFNINQTHQKIKDHLPQIDCKSSCAFMAGFLPYVSYWKVFLSEIAELFDYVIIGQNDFVRVGREKRKTGYTYNNAIFITDVILHMEQIGYKLENAVDFRLRSTILFFVKNSKKLSLDN